MEYSKVNEVKIEVVLLISLHFLLNKVMLKRTIYSLQKEYVVQKSCHNYRRGFEYLHEHDHPLK